MRRMRSDAGWNTLTPEQRRTVEEWLFIEHEGYEKIRQRMQEAWGVAMSLSSICEVRKRLELERLPEEMAENRALSKSIGGSKADLADLRASAWKVIGGQLLRKAVANADTKELENLGRLMAGTENREIELKRLALARERHEFRAARAALRELPRMEKMSEEELAREEAQFQAFKERLFGKELAAEIED